MTSDDNVTNITQWLQQHGRWDEVPNLPTSFPSLKRLLLAECPLPPLSKDPLPVPRCSYAELKAMLLRGDLDD